LDCIFFKIQSMHTQAQDGEIFFAMGVERHLLAMCPPLPPVPVPCACTIDGPCAPHRAAFSALCKITGPLQMPSAARVAALGVTPKGGTTAAVAGLRRLHFTCRHCYKVFSSHSTQKRHEREKHAPTKAERKPHKCQICGKRFLQASHVRAHMRGRVHKNKGPTL